MEDVSALENDSGYPDQHDWQVPWELLTILLSLIFLLGNKSTFHIIFHAEPQQSRHTSMLFGLLYVERSYSYASHFNLLNIKQEKAGDLAKCQSAQTVLF